MVPFPIAGAVPVAVHVGMYAVYVPASFETWMAAFEAMLELSSPPFTTAFTAALFDAISEASLAVPFTGSVKLKVP